MSRPLSATAIDQHRFVGRSETSERILDAVNLGRNVIVLGEPGSGRTSLLNRVAWVLDQETETLPVRVSGETARTAAQLLGVLVARVRRAGDPRGERAQWLEDLRALAMPDGPFGEVAEPALLMELVDLLADAVGEAGRPTCLIVDGLEANVAHTVFGGLRNEVWALGQVSWVLAGDSAAAGLYLEPPADAFFPVVVELAGLTDGEATDLLVAHGHALDAATLRRVLDAGRGNPRRLLATAADAAAGLPIDTDGPQDQARLARELAGPLAGQLVAYLADYGPASASDERLLRSLGASRQRVSQLMHQLEEAQVLQSTELRTNQRGRPARRFALSGGR